MGFKFIQKNIAPFLATKLGVYNSDGTKVGIIPLNKFKPSFGTRKYRFGVLSDVHNQSSQTSENTADLQNALEFFNEKESVSMTCICGDISQNGTVSEFQLYQTNVNASSPSTPVYTTTGNHDCTSSGLNVTNWKTYTGQDRCFEVTKNNDHFLFFGMNKWSFGSSGTPYLDTDIDWLESKLEEYRNERCFIFTHPFFPSKAGNFKNLYPSGNWIGGTTLTRLTELYDHYVNSIWFSGHSHWKWNLQVYQDNANVDDRTVHIPSCASPRIPNDAFTSSSYDEKASEGAIIDVYDEYIDIRGMDLKNRKYLPMAQYRIDTKLVEIDAKEVTVVEYTITNTLSNATNSNSATSITKNGSYTCNITANNGYTLSTVKVTMGGTDVTSTAYSNGKISISNVTGDIVITVATVTSVIYTVTNTLTNCTTNNDVTNIVGGDNYNATLTYNTTDYNELECSVTMGGTDITSTAYSNGIINITNVTGNIVIVANAVQVEKVELDVPISFENGIKLSKTDATYVTSTPYSASNFIRYSSDNIYTLKMPSDLTSHAVFTSSTEDFLSINVCYFDENKNFLHYENETTDVFNAQKPFDNISVVIPTYSNASYIRLRVYHALSTLKWTDDGGTTYKEGANAVPYLTDSFTLIRKSSEVPCESISVSSTNVTFTNPSSQSISVDFSPFLTTDIVTYSVNNNNISVVSFEGTNEYKIYPNNNGESIITFICGEKSATCVVNVNIEEGVTPYSITWINGKKIASADGTISDSGSTSISNFIDYSSTYTYAIQSNFLYNPTVAQNTAYNIQVAYYDGDKNFLSMSNELMINPQSVPTTVIVPEVLNAYYIRLRMNHVNNSYTYDYNQDLFSPDRGIHISSNVKATNPCIISYDLYDIEVSNNDMIVEMNSSYTTTLSATNTPILIDATVTMGGVDITSSVYSNGVINIPNVTGDVTIGATSFTTKITSDMFTLRSATGGTITQVDDNTISVTFTAKGQKYWVTSPNDIKHRIYVEEVTYSPTLTDEQKLGVGFAHTSTYSAGNYAIKTIHKDDVYNLTSGSGYEFNLSSSKYTGEVPITITMKNLMFSD